MNKIEYIINKDGCHICISHAKDSDGYPKIQRNLKKETISRYLWKNKYGPIPEKIEVCHKCDNRACINVEHFFLGTQKDNNKDCKRKNRQKNGISLGEKNGGVGKLTEKQVLQIRQESGTQTEIAKRYGVSQVLIGKIKNRKIWKWLGF